MIVSFIVAMDRRGLIGRDNRLPWHLPADLKRFRRLTLGKPIVMGRKTFESLGRPLDRRRNLVLTRDPGYHAEGCDVVRSLDEALALAAEGGAEEVMIIGGGEVFRAASDRCERLYLTVVEGDFEGSAYFPVELLDDPAWRPVHEEAIPADATNPHPHRFRILERDRPPPP